jgi:hypothetical protein
MNLTLGAGEHVLVVPFDPVVQPEVLAAFRYRNGLSDTTRLFGPWLGRLGNNGETVKLYRPDSPQLAPDPDAGLVPYVLVESVRYGIAAPWSTGTVATGLSLQRAATTGYGNEPLNWVAQLPTPGRPAAGYPNPDANGDGLPDAWQSQYFGTTSAPEAALGADPDQDGMSNEQEYYAGTDPSRSSSALRITAVTDGDGNRVVQFESVAGNTYSIQYRDSFLDGAWIKLNDVGPVLIPGIVSIPAGPTGTAERFYRVVTPAQP